MCGGVHTCMLLIEDFVILDLPPEVEPEGVVPEKARPCAASACGPSALCSPLEDGQETCTCPVGYIGNPYFECRPECTVHSDCIPNLACINRRCVDPCPGTCGINAACNVLSHQPNCFCPPGYSGNPYSRCFPETRKPRHLSKDRHCYHVLCKPDTSPGM